MDMNGLVLLVIVLVVLLFFRSKSSIPKDVDVKESLSKKYSILNFYKGLAYLLMIVNTGFTIYSLGQINDARNAMKKFGDGDFIKNNNQGYYIWKKKHAILLPEIYFLLNIKNESLNPKKVKGAIKEKKIRLV